MIPHEFRPFPPGTRVSVEGRTGEGYFTGGFLLMGYRPPLQTYLQVYWVNGGGPEAEKARERELESFERRAATTTEPIEKVRVWSPTTDRDTSRRVRFVIPGMRREHKRTRPRFVLRPRG